MLRLQSAVLALFTAGAAWAGPGELVVLPREVQVGLLFRGTQVHVSGTAPAGSRVAVVCTGPGEKVELKKKGKVGGLLWMNVGDVSFDGVPSLYLAMVEPGIGAPSQGLSGTARLGLGWSGLESEVLPATAGEERRKLFHDFIELRRQEGLYTVHEGARRSGSEVSADFTLPATVPAGDYRVELVAYHGGSGDILGSSELVVRRVGLAAAISAMSLRHGLLYGILCVVVALCVGFLTGVLFRGASKGH